MNLKTLLISLALITAVALLTTTVALIVIEFIYPSIGTVRETKATVYLESVEWTSGTTIDWGNVTPGEVYAFNLTVYNSGTAPFKTILLITGEPAGFKYTWTANGTILNPGAYAKADLTVTIPESATLGTYSFGTYTIQIDDQT